MINRTIIAGFLALTLAGCSGFKLGTVAYIPHGQVGTVSVSPASSAPPSGAASAAKP